MIELLGVLCVDYAKEADRNRAMAEEFRTMAACTPHQVLRDRFLFLAQGYDQLAANEDRVAANLKMIE